MKRLLICFDVDGTLIDDMTFIWKTLHERIGTDPDQREYWADAFWSKKITYAEWARKDVDMWIKKGITRQGIMAHLTDLKPMVGAMETLSRLKGQSHVLGVISGSLDIALEQIFPDWNTVFDHILLNRLIFGEDDRLTGIVPTPFDIEHKATGLRHIAQQCGIPLEDSVYIGDNFNDVDVAKIAGCAIAYNCKSDLLAENSDYVVPGPDLRAILPMIDEFARTGE